jgi:hypothetical protein
MLLAAYRRVDDDPTRHGVDDLNAFDSEGASSAGEGDDKLERDGTSRHHLAERRRRARGSFDLDVLERVRDTLGHWLPALQPHLPGAAAAREHFGRVGNNNLDAIDPRAPELTPFCIQHEVEHGHLT